MPQIPLYRPPASVCTEDHLKAIKWVMFGFKMQVNANE